VQLDRREVGFLLGPQMHGAPRAGHALESGVCEKVIPTTKINAKNNGGSLSICERDYTVRLKKEEGGSGHGKTG